MELGRNRELARLISMSKLQLKFVGDGSAFTPNRAWIILGDHGISQNGDKELTPDCASIEEVEEQVKFLKKELDGIVTAAKRKFSK